MKVNEIRELTTEQIESRIIEAKDEIFNLRLNTLSHPNKVLFL